MRKHLPVIHETVDVLKERLKARSCSTATAARALLSRERQACYRQDVVPEEQARPQNPGGVARSLCQRRLVDPLDPVCSNR